MYPRSLS